jgi:uncharacterized protein YprB with RNaseH-like and TPR domain
MDLRAKLGRLRAEALAKFGPSGEAAAVALPPPLLHAAEAPQPSAAEQTKAARIAQLRALIRDVAERDQKRAERQTQPKPVALVEQSLPWERVETAFGTLHTHSRWLEPQHRHGRAPLADALRVQQGTLAALTCDAALTEIALERALYLDTETTGLAGGTGTLAFLVGLAFFEEGALRVEQLIVPQLGAEQPVLQRLAERLAAASCMVTYNGKSFDWPLLRTRYVLARLPVPQLPPHVDLLHTARRIWKPRLQALRLCEVEREVLHFFREDDIAGHEIPARYFAFVRGGTAQQLVPVLEHNQNDLIALAALLGALITRFEQLEIDAHPQDALCFGRLALQARNLPRAVSFAEAALAASEAGELRARSLLFASQVQRRAGDPAQAVALLEQLLALPAAEPLASTIHFALAKLYEHALGELRCALRHARYTEAVEGSAAQGRRLGRLYRRLLKRAEGTT